MLFCFVGMFLACIEGMEGGDLGRVGEAEDAGGVGETLIEGEGCLGAMWADGFEVGVYWNSGYVGDAFGYLFCLVVASFCFFDVVHRHRYYRIDVGEKWGHG